VTLEYLLNFCRSFEGWQLQGG